jgi:hypothetical protein
MADQLDAAQAGADVDDDYQGSADNDEEYDWDDDVDDGDDDDEDYNWENNCLSLHRDDGDPADPDELRAAADDKDTAASQAAKLSEG